MRWNEPRNGVPTILPQSRQARVRFTAVLQDQQQPVTTCLVVPARGIDNRPAWMASASKQNQQLPPVVHASILVVPPPRKIHRRDEKTEPDMATTPHGNPRISEVVAPSAANTSVPPSTISEELHGNPRISEVLAPSAANTSIPPSTISEETAPAAAYLATYQTAALPSTLNSIPSALCILSDSDLGWDFH